MTLDIRTAQTQLENALRDTILFALGHRLPSVSSVAALRSVQTRGATATIQHDDVLIPIVVSGIVTASYRWSSISTASDDGATVIKPIDVPGNGRWLSWTSPQRFEPTVGGNSFYLHELQSGPLRRVIILDKSMSEEEINSLIIGQVPSVVIEATDDDPDDATLDVSYRWFTDYGFTVSIISQNLRDRREAAQGSSVSGDIDPGANTLDGHIKALLGGTQLFSVVDGVRAVRVGRGHNWLSEMGQRRVVRSRSYTVQVTEAHPNAPNDYGAAQEVDTQAELVDLHDRDVADTANYVISGITVLIGAGLAKSVTAGNAIIAGSPVSYAGEFHLFGAYRDTYRDLSPSGTVTFVEVTAGGPEPAIASGALRIGMTRTDSSSVILDRYIAITKSNYLANYQHSLL